MSGNQCPACQVELNWKDGQYYCDACQHPVRKRAFCPDCDSELEKLQACGSASYFCHHHCNELKSKSRVKVVFERL